MSRPPLGLAALLTLLLALALDGCVLTTASLQGLGGRRHPPHRAVLEEHHGRALVVQELEGDRRKVVPFRLGPGAPPPALRVAGGPVRSTCACFRSAYGLVEHHGGLPYVVEAQGADGRWTPLGVEALPFEERSVPGAALSYCLLPLTIGLDLALLPLEAVFVLVRG